MEPNRPALERGERPEHVAIGEDRHALGVGAPAELAEQAPYVGLRTAAAAREEGQEAEAENQGAGSLIAGLGARTLVSAALVAALAPSSATAGGAQAQAPGPLVRADVSVDFAQPRRLTRSLTGFLHGMHARVPSAELVGPLRPGLWRGSPGSAHPVRAERAGALFSYVLSERWGYPVGGWGRNGPPYADLGAWRSAVRRHVRDWSGDRRVVWDVWNEPESSRFWDRPRETFFEVFAAGSRAVVDAAGRDAEVSGPSIGRWDPEWLRAFLDACVRLRCRLTALSWHEFPDGDTPIATIADHLRQARRLFLSDRRYRRLGLRELHVNEVMAAGDHLRPGEIVAFTEALERGRADAAARACWAESDGRFNCRNDTLDGLLTPESFRPRSAWWAVRAIDRGWDRRVRARSSTPVVSVLASRGPGGPHVVVGRPSARPGFADQPPASVTLRLRGLERVPALRGARRLEIAVASIPNTLERPLRRPRRGPRLSVRVRGGAASVTLPPLGLHDATVVELRRGGARR